MAVEWQFLMTEVLVACASITTLLVLLTIAFAIEHRTPGPVFSRKSIRRGALQREEAKYSAEEKHVEVEMETPLAA
jgi:hypothetical protein